MQTFYTTLMSVKMATTASASLLKTSPTKLDKSEWVKGHLFRLVSSVSLPKSFVSSLFSVKASYADELVKTAVCVLLHSFSDFVTVSLVFDEYASACVYML